MESAMSVKRSAYQPHFYQSDLLINDDQQMAELLSCAAIEPAPLYSLPPDLENFIGRKAEIQQSTALWQQLRSQEGARVLAIVGPAGVGKSALALHLAHQFQPISLNRPIYLNLRSDQPISPDSIEQQILPTLRLEQLDGPFPGTSNDRRILLLDNLENQAQLRPLLTLSASYTIIVTSRQPIDGVATLKLQSFSELDAITLLETIALKSVQDEPEIARTLVHFCDALPLPLRLMGGLLRTQTRLQLIDCLQLLIDERKRCEQARFSSVATRASFNLSYQSLDARSARLLRLLGLLVQPNFTLKTAAAVTEIPLRPEDTSISQLLQLRLLESAGDQRYHLPAALRPLVKGQLAIEESVKTRQAARLRLSQVYQETAEVMSLGLNAISRQQVVQVHGQEQAIAFEQSLSLCALRWFETERLNLLATLDWAIQAEADQIALSTATSLSPFLDGRGDWADWKTAQQTIITVTEKLNHTEPEHHGSLQAAQMLNNLGNAYLQQGNWKKAEDSYQQSLAILHEHQKSIQESQTIANLGIVYLEQGDSETAAMLWTSALMLLPTHSTVHVAMTQWMQSINDSLFQSMSRQVDHQQQPPRTFLSTIEGVLKRLIP
jgi:tetratricopeptide (TPR) repeat protein